MIRFFSLFLCLLFLPHGEALASDPLWEAVCTQYAQMRSMQAALSMEITYTSSRSVQHHRGLIYYKKPSWIRYEQTGPQDEKELTVVNENAAWHVIYEEEAAIKFSPDVAGSFLEAIIVQPLINRSNWVTFAREEDGSLVKFLMAFPAKGEDTVVECIYWVDPADTLIKKIQTTGYKATIPPTDVRRSIVFNTVTLDHELDPKLFTFSPPRGMEVLDQTRE